MRTEENLRDAVRKFLEDWPCPACFGHELCCSRPRLKQALAEAGEEPEMKQLMRWLLREAIDAECDSAQEGAFIRTMDHIESQFGYTPKEQEDKT